MMGAAVRWMQMLSYLILYQLMSTSVYFSTQYIRKVKKNEVSYILKLILIQRHHIVV